jgi:hypothetical protein
MWRRYLKYLMRDRSCAVGRCLASRLSSLTVASCRGTGTRGSTLCSWSSSCNSNEISFIGTLQHYWTRSNPTGISLFYFSCRSQGSSGSIMSDYELDDRAIGVRSPAEVKNFSSILCVQTGSGFHPASCPKGSGSPFPWGKVRPGRDADHSSPSIAEVVNE